VYSIAIIHTQYGPYHLARAHALTRVFPGSVDLIQLAAKESQRQWVVEEALLKVSTITSGVLESYPKKQLIDGLIRYLEHNPPSTLVVAGYSQPAMRAAIVWGKKRNIPIVLLSDSQLCDRPRNFLVENIKSRWICHHCSAAFVAGASAAQYLHHLGFPEHKIWRGYDVVDNNYFTQASELAKQHEELERQRLNLPENYLLYVGRLAPEKNLFRLLEALSLRQRSCPSRPLPLVVVGSGGQEKELREKAQNLNLKDILWVGFKQIDQLPIYYALASALILPSISEPWGLVINEAMACGLPVLASSRCGAVLDLVFPGVNGFVFDPFDCHSISHGITSYLNLSKEQKSSMGVASRQFIQNFSPETWARALTDCVIRTSRTLEGCQ
jgi:glycosyltransferase involved in cell wall biosynthesis